MVLYTHDDKLSIKIHEFFEQKLIPMKETTPNEVNMFQNLIISFVDLSPMAQHRKFYTFCVSDVMEFYPHCNIHR